VRLCAGRGGGCIVSCELVADDEDGLAPEGEPDPDAWAWLVSKREDNDAFRTSFRWVDGGVGGLRPECDFWPRRLPGFGERNETGGADVRASL
jgi:hypothetical protein